MGVYKSLSRIYIRVIAAGIPLETLPSLDGKLSRFVVEKMSPTDAKRGAKRRKNKRGGGSSCSAVCNTSGGKAGVASALGCAGTATPASVVSFLTPGNTGSGNMGSIAGLNGEVRVSHNVNRWMSKRRRLASSVINDTSDLGPRLMRGRELATQQIQRN